MARIVITQPADSDIAGILAELGKVAGYRLACVFDARFEKLFDRLSDYPDSGPLRPALGRHIRIGVVAPYVVVYRHDEAIGAVNLLRVLHGSRRYPTS